MNYFRKMVMLPIDEFNKYKNILYLSQVTPNPNPLQKELEQVRETYGTSLPDDQRVKLESEIIQKYSSKNSNVPSPLIPTDPQQLAWIGQSLQNFPKANKNRAVRLHTYLDTRSLNRWNEKGELLTSDASPIPNSNILDLINFVTTTQKIDQTPIGFTDFIKLLIETNVPTHMLSKNGLKHINNEVNKQQTEEEEDNVGFYTPHLTGTRKRKSMTTKKVDVWTS